MRLVGSPQGPQRKRGVAAGRSAQRGTSGATTGGGGRSAPDPEKTKPPHIRRGDATLVGILVRQPGPRQAIVAASLAPNRVSHIVALSLLSALRRLQQPIVVG